MYKRWICFCGALLFWSITFSQTDTLLSPIPALLHTRQPLTINWRDNAFPLADTPYNRFPQELLKTKDGLFLFVNGSGRLYQLLDSDTGIQAQRIDATFFSGYNFGSYAFVYHDSIYSLGGYGLWRINGQLRVYVPQAHSWDIVPLSEEIPVLTQEDHHDMFWYNEKDAKLYIAYSMVRNQAVKHSTLNESSFDYTVRFLDLKSKDWHVAGPLHVYFRDKVALLRNIAFTPWGQLVSFGDKLLIIDYANNRLLRIQDAAQLAIRPILFQHPNTNLYYCIDSTLFFGNIAENRLSSLQLHSYDFADAGIAVYTVPTSPVSVIAKWIAGIAVASVLLFALWRKKKRSVLQRSIDINKSGIDIHSATPEEVAANEEEEIASNNGGVVVVTTVAKPAVSFEEKELRLLQVIINNSHTGKPTTIEEVNMVLGLAKINYDAQKNQRSLTISSINHKYARWQQTNEKLIESKPAETDKRSRIYCIAPEKEAVIVSLLAGGEVS